MISHLDQLFNLTRHPDIGLIRGIFPYRGYPISCRDQKFVYVVFFTSFCHMFRVCNRLELCIWQHLQTIGKYWTTTAALYKVAIANRLVSQSLLTDSTVVLVPLKGRKPINLRHRLMELFRSKSIP